VLVYSALLLPLLVGCVLVGKSLSVVLSWGSEQIHLTDTLDQGSSNAH